MTPDARPLVEGSVVGRTLRFGGALAAALALHGVFNFVDIAFVGRLDAGSIAAVSVAGVVVMIPMLLFDAISGAAVAELSAASGRGDDAGFGRTSRALFGLAGAAFVACVAAVPVARAAVDAYFEPGTSAFMAGREYLDIMMFGAASMFFLMSASAVYRGVGRGTWPVVLLVGANLLNVLLNWMLIYGNAGAPRLEVAGAAHATVVSRGLAAALGCGALVLGIRARGGAFRVRLPERTEVMRLLGGGMLVALQLSVRVAASLWVIRVACRASGGVDPVALMDGVGVANRLEMIPVFVALGWGAAATTVVGQNLGAGKADRAFAGLGVAVTAAVVTGGVLALGLWGARDACLEALAPNASSSVREEGFRYWAWSLPFFPGVAVAAVVSRGLNGAGRFGGPLLVDLCAYGVLLPALSLPAASRFGPTGVWAAYGLVHLIAAIVFLSIFFRRKWCVSESRTVGDSPRS